MPVSPVTIDRQDPRYDSLKKGRNLRFPATDAEAASRVLICSSPWETAEALQRMVSSGLRPTVRSGGHCYEDFVVNNPNGAILDVSLLNTIDAAPGGRPMRVAPGAVLGDIYHVLYKRFGVTIPGGSCYSVGAGGHIAGGGYGLLSRLQGLTCDWVTGVDILTVDVNGKVVERQVDKLHDPDLFRACRGAGSGNFGVITGFRFDKLPPAPREVAEASMSFAWSSLNEAKFTKLLTLYGDYWEGRGKDPDTWGLFALLGVSAGAGPNGRIGIGVQFCNPDGTTADLTVLHEFFARFAELNPTFGNQRQNGGPRDATVTPLQDPYQINRRPWIDAAAGGGGGGGSTRGKYKSAYMKRSFTSNEASAIYRFMTSPDVDPRGATLAIDSYGGATNTLDRAGDTSIVQRSSVMKLQYQCYWRDQEQDASRLKFMDDYFTAVYTGPHVAPEYQGTPMGERYEGCYMNYADADMIRYAFWPKLFYGTGDLYPFLQKVKKQYDPNNIFHSSMSVRA
jgi:FAD/FMN-containing dehydrogenase